MSSSSRSWCGGSTALWLAKLAVALLTVALLWRTVRRHARSPWVWGSVMVLILATMSRGYAVRPQVEAGTRQTRSPVR